MILSMTAFAQWSIEDPMGQIHWEVRTVNHRYLDVQLKLPEGLGALELTFKTLIQQYLKRGKVEASLSFFPKQGQGQTLTLNPHVLSAVTQLMDQLDTVLGQKGHLDVMKLLAWPDLVQKKPLELASLKSALCLGLEQALQEAVKGREREGACIYQNITDKLKQLSTLLEQAKPVIPKLVELQKKKIQDKFFALEMECDPLRLEQEIVQYAQRVDISEELERIEGHLQEVQRVLSKGQVIGRRLDFLMQELNREANTLGSKALSTQLTDLGVQMKVLIEQIREQSQNVE